MTELELNKEYTYLQICEAVGWEKKAGNSKKAQINEIESAYEFYHPINNKTHKPKKSYIFTGKIRDLVEPSKSNCGGAHNTKNIQHMIDYLQAKFDLDDNWYSFTDWYCVKLELMYKGICNAIYHEDEIEAVCEKENISDEKLFYEYVSAAKAELKNMFLKSLSYLEKKDKAIYHDEYKFIYQLGERTRGYVITDCLNNLVKEIETIVCNDLNEEHHLSEKMKGRQLLKIIYSKKNLTEGFKEFCLLAMNDNDNLLNELNEELSCQHITYHPDYGSICSKRPLVDYRRGISINDMELEEIGDLDVLAIEITNKIRVKVRRTLRKNYRKFMKQSDLLAIEKALFQHLDRDFVDEFGIDTSDNWGEVIDFSIEEILDMPTLSEVQMNLTNSVCEGQNDLCKEDNNRIGEAEEEKI